MDRVILRKIIENTNSETGNTETVTLNSVINEIRDSDKYPLFERIMGDIKEDFFVTDSIHGVAHNERVALMSFYIALKEGLSDKEIELVVEAAKYHDIGRKEVKGREHGRRSAQIIEEHADEIFEDGKSQEDIDAIRALCIAHSTKDEDIEEALSEAGINTNDSTLHMIRVLKDADALDRVRLPRFGRIDTDHLRTEVSKTMVEASRELYKSYRQAQYDSGLSMNSELFGMGQFNVIEDDENYYIFRTINGENVSELEDENEEFLRTHRERANAQGRETSYGEDSRVSLQEVYDSVKVTKAGKTTNCISFSTNANVSLDFNNNRYIMVAVPKSSADDAFAAGKYMLEEIDKRVADRISRIDQSSRSIDLISQIDSSESVDEIREIVGESYTGVKREEGRRYTGKIQSRESFVSRFDRKQYFTEEQQLEYAKVVAKMSILEISGEMRSVLPSQSTNSNLLSALGTAFSASEAIHYGAIPKERVISISEENMEMLAILQQASDQETVDLETINRLKSIVLEYSKSGQTFEIEPENITEDDISIEDAFNYFTAGGENYKLPYSKTVRAIEITKQIAASKNRVHKLCDVLKQLPECRGLESAIDDIAKNHIIPRQEFTTRANNDGIKIAESVSIDFNEESSEELFSHEEMADILNVINEYNTEELEEIISGNPNSEITSEFLNILLSGREYEGGLNEYYAEAIVGSLDIASVYKVKPPKAKQNEIRSRLIERLQAVDAKKLYDTLVRIDVDEKDIPGIITNLILEDGIGDERTDTLEKLVSSDDLEEVLLQRKNSLTVRVQPLHLDGLIGARDNFNLVPDSTIRLKDYQQKALENIDEIYEERRFAGLVLPTGSGKSFVAMSEMLEHKKETIIYFAPQTQILSQVQKHILKNIVGKEIITDDDIEELKEMPDEAIEEFLSSKVYNRGINIRKEIADLKRATAPEAIERIKQRFRPRQTKDNDDVMNEIHTVFPHLDMYCYASLNGQEFDKMIETNPDLIIFDEAHRTGAYTWQERIENLLESNLQSKILAVTATPERDSDLEQTLIESQRETPNMLDYMAERYGGYSKEEIEAEEHLAENMTLIEAMQRGIVVEPIIVGFNVTLADTEEYQYVVKTIERLKEKDESNPLIEKLEAKKAEMDAIIEGTIEDPEEKSKSEQLLLGMQETVAEHVPDKQKDGKFIVFLPQKPSTRKGTTEEYVQKEMKKVSKYFSELNPDIEAGYLLSNRTDGSKNAQAINDFESSDNEAIKLLFAIDMLNEGVHVDGINGEMMLRKIGDGSNILYFQQIGRVIYAVDENEVVADEDRPIIFDVYNNSLSRNLDYQVNKTTPKSDLKRLQEIADWVQKHQRIPDINSEDLGEARKAVFLKRTQSKYEKYLEGILSKNLTQQQRDEIEQIVEICKGLNVGNEEVNLFELDFPERILPPPEGGFRVTAFQVTGEQKRFLDLFDEAKREVERSKPKAKGESKSEETGLSDWQRLEKIMPILKTLSDYGVEIEKDTFKEKIEGAEEYNQTHRHKIEEERNISIREIIERELPENARKQILQDFEFLRVSDYDLDNYDINWEYNYALYLFDGGKRGKGQSFFDNYSFDEIRACGILNGHISERGFYHFRSCPGQFKEEIEKINGTHIITGTKRDENGFDRFGYDSEGYDENGFDKRGYDREGFDKDGANIYGFNRDGLHIKTETHLDPNGFDEEGFYWAENSEFPGDDSKRTRTQNRINEYGFDRMGRYFEEKDGELVHAGKCYHSRFPYGYQFPLDDYEKVKEFGDSSEHDELGFELGDTVANKGGFRRDRINEETGTFFNKNGRDIFGRQRVGDSNFVGSIYHAIDVETGKPFDRHFFDVKGFYWDVVDDKDDSKVYFEEEYETDENSNKRGRTLKKTDPNGFAANGKHRKTRKMWDEDYFDIDGNYWREDPEHPFERINTNQPLNSIGLDREGVKEKREEVKQLREQKEAERKREKAEARQKEIERIKRMREQQKREREEQQEESYRRALQRRNDIDAKRKESAQERGELLAKLLEENLTQEEICALMEQYCGILEIESGNRERFEIELKKAIKDGLVPSSQFKKMKSKFVAYSTYVKPFDREKYFKVSPKLMLDDKSVVDVTEADVDLAIQYLEETSQEICHGAVVSTVKKLKQGELGKPSISGQDIGKASFDAPTADCDEAEAFMNELVNEQEAKIGGDGK